MVGRKLAAVVGGEVQSAPYIASPIRGGRVSITPGGSDVRDQELTADAIAAALSVRGLPPGGAILDHRWVAPAAIAARVAVVTLAIALVGGALAGALVGLAIAFARPVWRPRPPGGRRGLAGRRFAVTLLAPAALLVLGRLTWPGVNDVALARLFGGHVRGVFTIIDLGVRPIVAAFLLIELGSLLTPRWRRARLLPGPRIAMGGYVAALGVVLAVLEGFLVVQFAHRIAIDTDVFAPGDATTVAAVASLAAGTMLLVVVAGMIRQHGLGNGYGALIVADWVIATVGRIADGPSAGHALGALTIAAIAAATIALLRMRVDAAGEAPLRVPSSGIAALAATGAAGAVWFLTKLGTDSLSLATASSALRSHPAVVLGALVALVPLWSLAFSRPSVVAPLAAAAELAAPGWASWRRATLLSWLMLTLIAGAALLSASSHDDALLLCDPIMAMLLAAVVLDIVDELAARRADLVTAWPLAQAQHAELVQRALADAGIACHLRASHLRTLLAWFGPHVPIDVLVPAAALADARARIALLHGETPLREVFS